MQQETNGIDYEMIASIAKRNNADFTALCQRAEKRGARTEAELMGSSLRQPDDEWLTTEQAAARLRLTYCSFVSILCGGDLEYYGIAYRSRSRVKPKGRRGCGVLFRKADLDEVNRIRSAIRGSAIAALRVFQAMRKGLL